ncbi:hypothetical protein DSECCO2_293710 [anaerobic digester metagenome]
MKVLDRYMAYLKGHREDLIVILFFSLVSFFYLGANIFAGQIVAPMDLLLHYPGWSNTGMDIPVFNLERSDILDSQIPMWNFARDSILNGLLPLWNPFVAGGSPALATFTTSPSLLTPSFFVFLVFGGGVGFTLSLLAKLFFAGYGAYKLCRTELTVLPSIFGGITYMMCGFNASWLMWPHVTTSMWIPWVLWGIILLNRERTRKRIFFVAIPVALLIFGGFPFVTFSGLALGSLFVCWLVLIDFVKKDRISGLKSGILLFSATFAGIGLAAAQILPFAEWLAQFDKSWRHGGSILSLNDLDILWTPFKYTHDFGTNIVPQVERCGYVGILTLLFSIVAIGFILKYRKNALTPLSPLFWAPIIFLIMIPVFTISPLSTIVYQLPIFNSNVNTRLLVLLGLSFSIVGAYGLDASIKVISKLNRNHSRFFEGCVTVFLLAIIGIHIATMAPVGMSQNAVVPAESFYPIAPTISYVQSNLQPGQSVLATSAYMISGTLTYYGISDWFAHTYHRDSEKFVLLQVVTLPADSWKTAAIYDFNRINLESPLIDKLGVRYVLTAEKLPQDLNITKWQIMSFEDKIIVLENKDCPPGAYLSTPSGEVYPSSYDAVVVTEYSPNYREYHIYSPDGGVFVTTTRIWPGWVAYCNDQPVPIKPYLGILQSVEVPEGESVIKFTYVPYSFYIGLVISLATLVLLLLIPRKYFNF